MRTAPALALFTIGAILAYAVNVSVPGLDLNVVGTVLALVGLLWLAVEIGLELAAMRQPRRRRSRSERQSAPQQRPAPERYDPVIRPRREPGRSDPDGTEPTRVLPRRD